MNRTIRGITSRGRASGTRLVYSHIKQVRRQEQKETEVSRQRSVTVGAGARNSHRQQSGLGPGSSYYRIVTDNSRGWGWGQGHRSIE
ncbi:hypothetical protein RRG08_048042 [Elysia crispata]|uniref:Uncharacterized protein n=1 Tax=Elysia crispata TaxID=231223 RepID=A0AAE0Z2G3_9GAST|nr:hypothetical protein RRG08_048042 [Elysia crispata]